VACGTKALSCRAACAPRAVPVHYCALQQFFKICRVCVSLPLGSGRKCSRQVTLDAAHQQGQPPTSDCEPACDPLDHPALPPTTLVLYAPPWACTTAATVRDGGHIP